jgi:hypothetical protein
MTDGVEPDWNLLPHNAAAFFGLTPGFELRALKAAYGSLLRRYKPEKAPEEFQKIRAAFESLKRRFDESAGRSSLPPSLPIEFHQPIETARPHYLPPAEPCRDDPGKASSRSLAAEYEMLRANNAKTPNDYYALAILSDLVGGQEPGFSWWLHAGLRRYPDEPALTRLLSEYLGTEEAATNAQWALVATSQAIPSDRFYDVSRPLWDRVSGAVGFTALCALVDACEANRDREPGEGYVAFSWWMLTRAVWEQDHAWFDARIAELESLDTDLTRWDAAGYRDLVDLLIIYRQARHRIVTKRFVRGEMDRTVIACTSSSQRAADSQMVEAQAFLAAHERELLREFPPDSLGAEPLVMVWEHLALETANRLEIPAIHVDSDEEAWIREFAFSLLTHGWHPIAWVRAYWVYWFQQICKGMLVAVWAMTAAPVGGFAVVSLSSNPGGTIGGAILCIGITYALRWLMQLLIREQAETQLKASARLYRYVWRRRMIVFFQATPVPIGSLVNELKAIAREPHGKRQCSRAAYIAECLARDVGLRLLEIAMRYRYGLRK